VISDYLNSSEFDGSLKWLVYLVPLSLQVNFIISACTSWMSVAQLHLPKKIRITCLVSSQVLFIPCAIPSSYLLTTYFCWHNCVDAAKNHTRLQASLFQQKSRLVVLLTSKLWSA